MELRAVKATADYLATDPKDVKPGPMVRLVRELQSARNARIREDGIRRKARLLRGQ